MLRLTLALSLLILTGCPTDGGELPDLSWDPPVDDRGAGEVDFGTVAVGTNPPPSGTIVATNNTDEIISMGVDCDLVVGTPFNISCPTDRVDIQPLGSEDAAGSANNFLAVGGTLLVGPNDVGEVETTISFNADNTIWTFALIATVTN
mgnify:CR=1 FL=1